MAARPNNGNINIKILDETLRGSYANQISVMHTKDDFVLDFLSIYPPEGIINARVITNPCAYKRMVMAMLDNLKKFEEKFGEIQIADFSGNNENTPINNNIN